MKSNFFEEHRKLIGVLILVVIAGLWLYKTNTERMSGVTTESFGKGGAFIQSDTMATKSFDLESAPAMDSSFAAPSPQYGQQVIKTASLSLHVDSVRKQSDAIKAMIEGMTGYVDDLNINRYDGSYSAYMTLRVPSDKFDTTVSALKELAVYVNNEYSNSEDVTQYYNDLEAKITNREALEQQYLDVLKKASDVDAIVSITKALADVRSEIESLQIEKKSYDNQIQYSSISVSLEEDSSVSDTASTWSVVTTVKQAFSDWVVFLQTVADKGVYALVYGWPLLIVYLGWRIYRRRR